MNENAQKILYYENILEFKENTQSPLLLSDVKNWKLCRTCLTDTESLEFGGICVLNGGNMLTVQDMLKEAAGLQINGGDQLPTQICKDCLSKISMLYFFKLQIRKAEDVLKRLRNKLDTKQEAANISEGKMKNVVSTTTTTEVDYVNIDFETQDSNDKEQHFCASTTVIHMDHFSNDATEEELNYESDNNSRELRLASSELLGADEATIEHDFQAEAYMIESNSDDKRVSINLDKSDDEVTLLELDNETNAENSAELKEDSLPETAKPSTSKTTEVKTRQGAHPLLANLICLLCKEHFESQRLLVAHVQLQHPNAKAFKCRDCDATFAHMQSLSRHKRSHKPLSYRNKCDECNKVFLRADDMKRHMRIHSGERPYVCCLCQKGFKQISELSAHEISHAKEKRYECTVCGQRLFSRNGLYIHKKAHEGIKNFICAQCGRRFLTNGELKSHKRVHLKKKDSVAKST